METANKDRLSRYLARIQALFRMSSDTSIGGQRAVAEERLAIELGKFSEYRFSSAAEAKAAALSDSNTFQVGDISIYNFVMGERCRIWKRRLFSAVCYQFRCYPVWILNTGCMAVSGPPEYVSEAIELYKVLKVDIERAAARAYKAGNKASYCNSFMLGLATEFKNIEQRRFASEVVNSSAPEPEGLLSVKDTLAFASKAYLDSKIKSWNHNRRAKVGSKQGLEDGRKAADKFSQRRLS